MIIQYQVVSLEKSNIKHTQQVVFTVCVRITIIIKENEITNLRERKRGEAGKGLKGGKRWGLW